MIDVRTRPRRRRALVAAATVLGALTLAFAVLASTANNYFVGSSSGNDIAPPLHVAPTTTPGTVPRLTPAPNALPGGGEAKTLFGNVFGSDSQVSYGSDVYVQTDDPSATIERAALLVRDRGGSVARLQVSHGEKHFAFATFLIPSHRALQTVEEVGAMGKASSREFTVSNMGPTVDGIESEIRKAEAEVEALVKAVSTASTLEKARYEGQLARARSQLSAQQAQLEGVQNQVTFATVYVEMGTRPPHRFGSVASAAATGWSAMVSGAGFAFAGAAFLAPLVVGLGLLLLAAAAAWRLVRRGWAAVKLLFT